MEPTHVRRVRIVGLHGNTQMDVELQPGLNIIFGTNGTGKTTLLHFIANALDGDVERFLYVRFDHASIALSNDSEIRLTRRSDAAGIVVVDVAVDGQVLGAVTKDTAVPVLNKLRAALRSLAGGRPVYVPAFRTVLEGASSREMPYRMAEADSEMEKILQAELLEDPPTDVPLNRLRSGRHHRAAGVGAKTALCREWFGRFVPIVRFPALQEVSERLVEEYRAAELGLAQRDRDSFSDLFVQVVRAVFTETPGANPAPDVTETLASIRGHLEALQSSNVSQVYAQLNSVMQNHASVKSQELVAFRILALYEAALRARRAAQRDAFFDLTTFEESVNRFLLDKKLIVGVSRLKPDVRSPRVRVRWSDNREAQLSVLSSGERHLITLLFSATHMPTSPGVFLIDEPELSLHVDWQRIILGEVSRQVGERQIIACTHAPEVAAQHMHAVQFLPRSATVSLGPRNAGGNV